MWVFTTEGFVSVVKGYGQNADLIMRARDRESLIELSTKLDREIERTPERDYPYRLELKVAEFSEWLVTCVERLDYRNFKDAVHTERGHEYAHALLNVWSAMHDVEDPEARRRP